MTRSTILVGVIALIILGGAVVLLSQNKATNQTQPLPSPVQDAQQTTPLSVSVNLTAQNNSGESGTATLTALEGGKTNVSLNLSGAPTDIAQPAHIHSGSCSNLGDVVYPLTSAMNDQSETTLDVDLEEGILNKLPLAVNVHKSNSEINIYYSCGDIGGSGAGPTVTENPTNSPTVSPNPSQTPDDRRRGADKPED